MHSKAHTTLTLPLVLHHTRIYKCGMKNWRRSHTLEGSHSMGDGRIFLKTRRDASFNNDLSYEPNFDRIHLAGEYL
jgi:hypothetical protein